MPDLVRRFLRHTTVLNSYVRVVDAVISFPNGLDIAWNNGTLGSIKMPDINVTGDVGANFQVTTDFSIADVNHLTDFTKVLLTAETFDWEISGSNLSVSAIGITVPGINFPSKKVHAPCRAGETAC